MCSNRHWYMHAVAAHVLTYFSRLNIASIVRIRWSMFFNLRHQFIATEKVNEKTRRDYTRWKLSTKPNMCSNFNFHRKLKMTAQSPMLRRASGTIRVCACQHAWCINADGGFVYSEIRLCQCVTFKQFVMPGYWLIFMCSPSMCVCESSDRISGETFRMQHGSLDPVVEYSTRATMIIV